MAFDIDELFIQCNKASSCYEHMGVGVNIYLHEGVGENDSLNKIAHQMCRDHPFSQRNKKTEWTVGVGDKTWKKWREGRQYRRGVFTK